MRRRDIDASHALRQREAAISGGAMARFLKLHEAIEDIVRDGDTVAMEGFTHLIPFAAGHEVIRQKRKRLTLIRMTPDRKSTRLNSSH